MRKKVGFKFASLSVSTPDGKELAPKLQELLWDYLGKMRPFETNESLDLAVFMLYCSYVSRNADELGLEDFDPNYSIDEAVDNLGNKYLATGFVDYYAGMASENPALPDLRGIDLRARDLSKGITTWAKSLEATGLSLMEGGGWETAAAIQAVLGEVLASDTWGKTAGEFSSPLPIADLAARLADVEGRSVLDFACGDGMFLATSLSNGAKTVYGRDINVGAIMRAQIMCFFADPARSHDIKAVNALSAASATAPVQRVLVAPPIGMPLREYDIVDPGYYGDTLSGLMGDGAPHPRNFEDFCAARALESLEDGGIAVLHVSASFLFHQHKGRAALRSAIVEKGYLRAVIELPGGCVPGTGVKSAILVLEKKESDGSVLIVDADSKELTDKGYFVKDRGRCEITDTGIDWIVQTVKNREEISLVSTVATREQVLDSGSNLCYSAYGSVYDFDSILDQTRSTKDIMGDIKSAQASIDSLSEQIVDILDSIEKKGR